MCTSVFAATCPMGPIHYTVGEIDYKGWQVNPGLKVNDTAILTFAGVIITTDNNKNKAQCVYSPDGTIEGYIQPQGSGDFDGVALVRGYYTPDLINSHNWITLPSFGSICRGTEKECLFKEV